MPMCTEIQTRKGQGGRHRAQALRFLTLLLECFYSLLAGVAAFHWLAPHWGSSVAFLAAAVAGCIVFSLSLFAIVHQAPIRTAIQQYSRLHGEDARDAFFFLHLPAAIAVLAESAAAFALLGAPFPPTPLRSLAWGALQVLLLVPVYLCYRQTKVSDDATASEALTSERQPPS